jgi:hypothetical protein
MFKKIHSNRDPDDTLFSEIKKEFGEYFGKAETKSKAFLENHSRPVFKFMVGSMILSVILCFTVLRKHDRPNKLSLRNHQAVTHSAAISDGFSRIVQVGSALREMIALKKQVDSITAKKVLSPQDSLVLEKDLDRLQQINKTHNN